MATTYKILGSAVGDGATTWSALYTVPSATSAVTSTFVAANTNGAAQTFGVRVVKSGGATTYLIPYATGNIAAGSRVGFTEGWALAAGDVVQVASGSTAISFTLFGSEIA